MLKNALLVSVSILVGAGGVQLLHAAGMAPGYFLGVIDVKDQDGYKNTFLPEAMKSIKEGGGIYIGGGFNKTTTLDGMTAPNRVVLIKFDSVDAAKKWWTDSGKTVTDGGRKFADFKASWAIEGVEPK
jgi:uncharacterized protein (DUF1330 family)